MVCAGRQICGCLGYMTLDATMLVCRGVYLCVCGYVYVTMPMQLCICICYEYATMQLVNHRGLPVSVYGVGVY